MPWPPGLSCWDDSGTPAVVVTVGDLMSRSAKALVVLVPPGSPVAMAKLQVLHQEMC